jgi:hypothetical protein
MGLRLVVLGVGIGYAVSLLLTGIIPTQLWGVSADDPLTLVGVSVLLLTTGVVACWVPP